MQKLFTFYVFLIFSGVIVAQDPVVNLKVNVEYPGSKSGFKAELLSESGKKITEFSDKSGKLFFNEISFGEKYELIVSKKGTASKSFYIDTKTGYYPDEMVTTSITLDVEMITKKDFVSYEIVEGEPVGKMLIQNSGELEWNLSFNNQRKMEIEDFLNNSESIATENKKQYNLLVKETETWIEKKDASEAENSLAKLNLIAKTTKGKKLAEKIELLKGQNDKERELINKIMTVADSLYNDLDYVKSLSYYERIIRLEPNNTKAFNRIEEIEELLAEESDTIKRNVKTPTTELLANAKNAQEKRIYSSMGYQPTSYRPVERTVREINPNVIPCDHTKCNHKVLDCCELTEEQRKLQQCECKEEVKK